MSMAEDKPIFISYSSKDSQFVEEILAVLRELGLAYWKAPEMIPAGSNYAREIPEVIRRCDFVLLVLSKDSQESIWVEKEIDTAINYRKRIVPVKLDKEPLNTIFKFYLNNVQMVSMGLDKERFFEEFKLSILKFVSKDKKIIEENNEFNVSDTPKKMAVRRANTLSVNKVPVECKVCGGGLELVSIGTYSCVRCGKLSYDYLQTVRNYLEKYGPTPTLIIERETGIPRKVIDYFLKQEFLEIPESSSYRLLCKKCGVSIRTGELCIRCKDEARYASSKKDNKWRSRL